jgi:AraC-like DNA-binding protein
MSCAADEKGSFDRYVLYFGAETIRAFDSRLLPTGIFGKNIGLLYRLTEEEAQGLRKIINLCDRNSPQAELELVAALFLNRLTVLCTADRISRVGTPSFYIQDVLRYISEGFGERIDASKIASVFSVSRSKLDRDFKSSTGMTVHNYIDICRVNQAKYLLSHKKQRSMREIAATCGFESESCFFHFFKRITGVTPGEYRRDCKK